MVEQERMIEPFEPAQVRKSDEVCESSYKGPRGQVSGSEGRYFAQTL